MDAAPHRHEMHMKHRVYVFLRETLWTARFLFGAALCCGIYLLGALVWLHDDSFLYVFSASTWFSSFTPLFPICAALPYALTYRQYRKSRMDDYILQRCSAKKYLSTLFMRSAFSGFAVMSAGTLLFICAIPVLFPQAVISYEKEKNGIILPYMLGIAQAGNWFAYFGFYGILMGIAGAFFSVLALTVSAWVDSIYAVYICPILFLYAMDNAFENFHVPPLSSLMLGDYYFFETWTQALFTSLVAFGAPGLVCYILFLRKGRRDLCAS